MLSTRSRLDSASRFSPDSRIRVLYSKLLAGIETEGIELSPSDEAADFAPLSARDWIQGNLYILTEARGVKPLVFSTIQGLLMEVVEIMRELGLPVRLLVLKARRHQVSTWTQAVMFEDTVHHEGVKTIIVAHEDESKQTIFDMARTFFDYLPAGQKPMTRYSSKKELVFENPDRKTRHINPGLKSSYRVAIAKRKDVGRSQTVHNAHFSEVDFWGASAPYIMQALLPTIPNHAQTMVVMETTARSEGFGGEFFVRWQQAKKKIADVIRCQPLVWDREAQRLVVNRTFFDRLRKTLESGSPPYVPLFSFSNDNRKLY